LKNVESQVTDLDKEILELGHKLRQELGIEIAELDAEGSKFFKALYHNSPRVVRKKRV